MNSVILTGRLTKDPEVRVNPATQMAVAKFSLAVDRGKKTNGEDAGADFPSITCFGKTAEVVEKYTAKGRKILVQGRIQTGSYEKDGHRVYTTDVIADRIEFLDSVKTETKETQVDMDLPQGFSRLNDEDIPF